jgi:hypothetical protein
MFLSQKLAHGMESQLLAKAGRERSQFEAILDQSVIHFLKNN